MMAATILMLLIDYGLDHNLRGYDALAFCVEFCAKRARVEDHATPREAMELYAHLVGIRVESVWRAISYVLRNVGSPMAPVQAVRYFTAFALLEGARYED